MAAYLAQEVSTVVSMKLTETISNSWSQLLKIVKAQVTKSNSEVRRGHSSINFIRSEQ